jgi:hypothetical protein
MRRSLDENVMSRSANVAIHAAEPARASQIAVKFKRALVGIREVLPELIFIVAMLLAAACVRAIAVWHWWH